MIYPKNLKEVVYNYFDKEQDLEDFINSDNSDNLIKYHFSLGMYLRNYYKLWTLPTLPTLPTFDHNEISPDDISMSFIEYSQKLLKDN